MQRKWSFFIVCCALLMLLLYKSNTITKILTKIYITPEVALNPIKLNATSDESPNKTIAHTAHEVTKKIDTKTQPKKTKSVSKSAAVTKNTHKKIAKSFLKHSVIQNTSSEKRHAKKDFNLNSDRYNAKLRACLQNSFNINKNKLSFSMPIKVTIKVYLELLPNGILHDARLIEPTGIPDLDSFALFVCTDAKQSFPPIPKFLGNKNGKFIAFITLYPSVKQGSIELQSM